MNPEEIVVGDLVKLKSGDGIPTDGILIEVTTHNQTGHRRIGDKHSQRWEGWMRPCADRRLLWACVV